MNPDVTKPGTIKRKAITLTEDALIKESLLRADTRLPLLLEPAVEGLSLPQWAAGKSDFISQKLLSNGGILFRGFKVNTVNEFEAFLQSLVGDLFHYSYRSTPRTQVSGHIYTSTEYPQHQTILLHNEMSYSRSWPMVIGFFCLEASPEGGETPIADSRNVFKSIDPAIRDRFIEKNVMYVKLQRRAGSFVARRFSDGRSRGSRGFLQPGRYRVRMEGRERVANTAGLPGCSDASPHGRKGLV